MLWNLSIAFLPQKPYTAISKREPPLKVSFFLNLLHLGQHRFQTEAVLSFFAAGMSTQCLPRATPCSARGCGGEGVVIWGGFGGMSTRLSTYRDFLD